MPWNNWSPNLKPKNVISNREYNLKNVLKLNFLGSSLPQFPFYTFLFRFSSDWWKAEQTDSFEPLTLRLVYIETPTIALVYYSLNTIHLGTYGLLAKSHNHWSKKLYYFINSKQSIW